MIICITGTPGTGKSTLARILSRKLNAKLVTGSYIIRKYKLSEGRDLRRNCLIVDKVKFTRACLKECNDKDNDYIIDSHLSHFIRKRFVDLCIVCKVDIKVLNERLRKRRYSKLKIRENLDAEIFDVCYEDAKKIGHKIFIYEPHIGIENLIKKIR